MLIRCDKCSTLYELEEDLIPPRGAPVQCSKCQFVFTAYPAPRTESPRGDYDEGARSQLPPPSVDPPLSFPLREEAEPAAACSTPRFAILSAQGSVTLHRANVLVRPTAPGMLVTQ